MRDVVPTVRGPEAALRALRDAAPLTHCVTNAVVTGFTANALLSLGASPAMVDIEGEAGIFAGVADGALINLGTPNPQQQASAREIVAATRRWVLDPVAVGMLPIRTALAAELVAARPAIIRGNASEIAAVAGTGAGGRGVDSIDDPDSVHAAAALAEMFFANGWVASTTASKPGRAARSPSTPPKPPTRTSPRRS